MSAEVEKKGKPGRWLRVVLFVSLALNLAVVGAVGGMVLNGPPVPRTDRSDPALPYTRAFDEDQRRELRQALWRSVRRDGKAMRAAYLADYQRALALLRDEPFDPVALDALLQDQGKRAVDVRVRGQEVLMTFLSEMSVDERRAYANRLEQELEKMRHRGGRDRSRDDGKDGHRD
ncbi:periplasmic heavy metal sensor [Antarctobacter sp.]|uniref:periplasmic heavy metal sensor n=1 Tax=Antarctobacter sp. TaxID=1872577 RepID=UPI002B266771|nr:periplasmic heavy metal sensor [Antarctobacter sp.]